jgi:hypothetical protein
MAAEKQKVKTKAGAKETLKSRSDKEILDFIKNKICDQIEGNELKLKVGDLLKVMEIQKKLIKDNAVEDKFWEFIEKIRQEELKDE